MIATTGNEYEGHLRAKQILGKFLQTKGFVLVGYEIPTGVSRQATARFCFTADIYTIWEHYRRPAYAEIIFEIDGHVGHHSPRAANKDRDRDNKHWDQKGISTVRIQTKDIVGRKKVDLSIIWKDIKWQLKVKYNIRL